ncbi:MAG TPA: glycosyltransferase family 4 protein [Bryobacteraceae bacterium]|nr:glycosyltransferase family 4 protein [Bryobacteraceae bacterium]
MSEKPGILIVCEASPPGNGPAGTEAHRVAAALTSRGHRVHLLTRPPQGRSPLGQARAYSFALQLAYDMVRRRDEFDLVAFFLVGPHLGAGLAAAYVLRKAIAVKFSDHGIFTSMSRTAVGQFELGWLRDWETPLMLPDERMTAQAEAAGFPRSQLFSLPEVVDTDVFRPPSPEDAIAWRHKHGIPPDAKVAICTGRLSPQSGISDVMHGVADAAKADPASMLVLVGDGPARGELQSLAQRLDPSGARFRFAGFVPPAEIPGWLASADVFTSASPSQNPSTTLLEAMASGLPSVVSNTDGNLRVIQNQVHGLTTPSRELAAIGVALVALFSDPGLRLRLGTAARERVVENYSLINHLPRYQALFMHALSVGLRNRGGKA